MAASGYPKFPRDNWLTVRKRFGQSINVTVTEGYLASVLNMKPSSAKVRLSSLKMMKLINGEGKPTELAKRWRDDTQYAGACEEIRQNVYPSELLHAFPGPDPDPAGVARWFANQADVGEDASKQLAALYVLLCEADLSKLENGNSQTRAGKTAKGTVNSSRSGRSQGKNSANGASADTAYSNGASAQAAPASSRQTSSNGLTLHVDIQVHISPEMSLQQIDQIFKSIGTHLRGGDEPQ